MGIDLTGINNINEYYTNHYFSSIFEENAEATISNWRNCARDEASFRTPWSQLRDAGRLYNLAHDRSLRLRSPKDAMPLISELADAYLQSLGFPHATPATVELADGVIAPVYAEVNKANGAPLLWLLLANTQDSDTDLLLGYSFNAKSASEENNDTAEMTDIANEELATRILFNISEPPRWLVFIGLNEITLIDRNKWNEKRYLQFDMQEIFSRREDTTLQAMSVLLHHDSLCPQDGLSLLDKLDENSHRHASGVSQDLKYALRESIELLGNEVLYDLANRQGRNFATDPVDAAQLSIECLRYMYRMLFMLFIESRPELGYAPMKAQVYVQGYSLESMRDIADNIREEISEVADGYYLHETISKLFNLIYNGYPESDDAYKELSAAESLHDVFLIEPLKAHIFDPEYTPLISAAKLRNKVMLRIIDLMSITRPTGRRNNRRGRISYSSLGINQMGAVYEALLSYRGFIAEHILFEVKRARDEFNELDVGYFVPENQLDNYTEEERVRYADGKLRKYEKGTFIYRLAGREREKSASYYTPEVLTRCLVKYALKELLEGKSADEILQLTICEPAMGSAAFLNEAINQLAESYLEKKQAELGETISYEIRYQELQKVKMLIADRNVYGIDLNPIAVELAEVSLWLNTIFKGGYVPWFGTQLVNGNSLIGARRQCYRVEQLEATNASAVWHNNAPDRVMPGDKRMPKKQVYHFLAADPGMSKYTDNVIKSLAPDGIRAINNWNRRFTAAHNAEDIATLLRLSEVIDDLWGKQVELRKTVNAQTSDAISVYGQPEDTATSHTTIREKDLIYKRLYKSEEMTNAGPYARLKFAMDYWCALWFWPIDQADMLPSRSEFYFDMSMILEGTISSVKIEKGKRVGKDLQLSMFPNEMEEKAGEILSLYDDKNVVDLNDLCLRNPRLNLVKKIAEQNKFMHWELEFADLFEKRGGFDLVIGNPPWIKMTWNEQAVLSDRHPIFSVKNISATQTTKERDYALTNIQTRDLYFAEYEAMVGMQNFLGATQNYPNLNGAVNLYKCFLPQSWMINRIEGFSAFIHPEGVFDDPSGIGLRKIAYNKLRKHFQFINERLLFQEVGHPSIFSLNIYSNINSIGFDTIANLFGPTTIDECYQPVNDKIKIPGIKDDNNNWNLNGHPSRVLHIGEKELKLFAQLLDGTSDYASARIPSLHTKQLLQVLECFAKQNQCISNCTSVNSAEFMWHETYAQTDNTIKRHTHFVNETIDFIYSGPHIGVGNPLFKTPRRICIEKADYDCIDLCITSDNYIQRSNYTIDCEINEYIKRTPIYDYVNSYIDSYRLIGRKMLNLKQERTLIMSIIPPKTGHINGLTGFVFRDKKLLSILAGTCISLPYDFFIKSIGKANLHNDNFGKLPVFQSTVLTPVSIRALMLNCLTKNYLELWKEQFCIGYISELWSKSDSRLCPEKFSTLTSEWTWKTPLRTDYERRQALVEIDVLTAMALEMTLEQLKTIYRIQFPVLQSYEADTWYDRNGRIVFTNNRSLTGVGYSRPEWEQIKDASEGEKFYRIINDDTMPGGPVERTIEYVAPFDRCDREADYDTAWDFFAEKYKDKE